MSDKSPGAALWDRLSFVDNDDATVMLDEALRTAYLRGSPAPRRAEGIVTMTPTDALLALMRFCDAQTYLGDRPHSCCEEPGHAGPHRRGALTWTDADPIPRNQPAPRSGT